jgi:uncharacterized membrane protein YhaH (DUF805 family)
MGMGEAVSSVLSKYAVFQGRARRAEYWFFFLFYFLISIPLTIIDMALLGAQILSSILALALIIPSLAVTVRRLHDLDKSGWFILIGLIPLIGTIILIVWFCTAGTPGPNRFGEDPLG